MRHMHTYPSDRSLVWPGTMHNVENGLSEPSSHVFHGGLFVTETRHTDAPHDNLLRVCSYVKVDVRCDTCIDVDITTT